MQLEQQLHFLSNIKSPNGLELNWTVQFLKPFTFNPQDHQVSQTVQFNTSPSTFRLAAHFDSRPFRDFILDKNAIVALTALNYYQRYISNFYSPFYFNSSLTTSIFSHLN